MFKTCINFLIGVLCAISPASYALSSSSYLISKTAINLFDYEEAYSPFNEVDIDLGESHLIGKLFTLVSLNLISEAKIVSQEILTLNNLNQEAWVVSLVHAITDNPLDLKVFEEFKQKTNKTEMSLLYYIFLTEDGRIKKNNLSARSIFEVVQASRADNNNVSNHTYLLFYLSLANLLDPDFNESYFYSAQIYQVLQNFQKAEILYKKIDKNHNLHIESQKNIAFNKTKMGFFNEGEELLLELIDKNNKSENLILALADIYRFEQRYEEAIKYYTKIINSGNNYFSELWRIHYLRGVSYERLSKWNLAEKDFLLSLEIKADAPQVLNYLAYGWLERGQHLERSIEMLQKAYKANPQSYYILDSLAWGYYKKNQLQKALNFMEEVIVLAPGEAISLDHLGDIYFSMMRKREAVFFWKQALDLAEPEDMLIDLLQKKIANNDDG